MATCLASKSTIACEPCRRRKTKCDGSRPQCGACYSTHTPCVLVNERPRRGPKKGELRALKAQVAMLEKQLAKQKVEMAFCNNRGKNPTVEAQNGQQQPLSQLDMSEWMENVTAGPSTFESIVSDVGDIISGIPQVEPTAASMTELSPLLSEQPEASMPLDDLVRVELDTLYFNRVHPLLPMIHQWRYLSWATDKSPCAARSALRLAMWTLATAFSVQYRALGKNLYQQARQMASLDGAHQDLPWDTAVFQLEQTQAWLLLAYYEFICMSQDCMPLTAARVYRLVQASGLHNIDAASSQVIDEETMIVREEKRRTFWVAFCIDRLITAQDSLHITLQEEILHVRLPTPSMNPQSSKGSLGHFLQEAISQTPPSSLCSFSENIVLTALYGRCVTHRRLASANNQGETTSFWKRHEWLAATIEQRTQPLPTTLLELEHGMERGALDMFTHFLARSAAIHLSDTATLWLWSAAEHESAHLECRRRAFQAAMEITNLARSFRRLSSFRVHPCLPRVLAHAAAFLRRNRDTLLELDQQRTEPHAEQELLDSLRHFQTNNASAVELLRALEAGTDFVF
ncbi:uncharacterized protein B0I36DRAFT_244774 [Microdochium trichocladiopsis]|uniref:Zn(2)-C6 fungal-type domain-containing protein n=1 Tax=Microdochium trichocladiopsis TaxID=1682393 RepID=A0A9P8Y4L4_9PEZI|nr:uncharacterized protein B0I36DRAFT_244774 [Microdochium trichocladiopsis]KAH7029240.1 hypothetical protein B0I36DRAFT_244774 [Microdochium trichocladiopsis]